MRSEVDSPRPPSLSSTTILRALQSTTCLRTVVEATRSFACQVQPIFTSPGRRSPSPRSYPPSCSNRHVTAVRGSAGAVRGTSLFLARGLLRRRQTPTSAPADARGVGSGRRTCRGCPRGSPSPCRCRPWPCRLVGVQARGERPRTTPTRCRPSLRRRRHTHARTTRTRTQQEATQAAPPQRACRRGSAPPWPLMPYTSFMGWPTWSMWAAMRIKERPAGPKSDWVCWSALQGSTRRAQRTVSAGGSTHRLLRGRAPCGQTHPNMLLAASLNTVWAKFLTGSSLSRILCLMLFITD
jgi:hypothetical protein